MVIYILREKTDSDAFIARCVEEYAKLYGMNMGKFSIIREKGKPKLSNGELFISLTHSFHSGDSGYTLCAVSKEEVGIDCEKVRNFNYKAIADRFFKGKDIASEKAFFMAWTAAEANSKKEDISLVAAMKKSAPALYFELPGEFLVAVSGEDKDIIFCPLT